MLPFRLVQLSSRDALVHRKRELAGTRREVNADGGR